MEKECKDPTDYSEEKSSIHEETDCIDGACNWCDNTPAQSEDREYSDKEGG